MSAHPFVLASKVGVLQKLLEGDPQTIAGVAIAIPVTILLLFFAAKGRRAINARRGRGLHAELSGSRLVEHSSGELIFELHYEHQGIQTVISGLQTGRKSEQSTFTLPLPPGWTSAQLLAGLGAASDFMTNCSVEPHEAGALFRCEGIGLPGEFIQGIMAVTADVIADVSVDNERE